MYIDTTFPPDGSGRLGQLMRMVDAMPYDALGRVVEVLIAQLDARDGDPDLEDSEGDTAIDDGPHDGDTDREAGSWPEDINQGSLREYGDDDREAGSECAEYARHLARIRRTRCIRIDRRPWGDMRFADYRLKA